MEIRFTNSSNGESYAAMQLQLKPASVKDVKETVVSGDFGELLLRRNKLKGVTVWHHALQATSLVQMTCFYNPTFVGIHAALEGRLHIHSEGVPDVLLKQREYVLGKLKNVCATFTVPVSCKTRSLHIHYSLHYFRQLLHYCPLFALLLTDGNSPCIVHEQPYFINEKMLSIVNEILQNNYPAALQPNYVHVKSVELLMHVTKEIVDKINGGFIHHKHGLNEDELQALYSVPEILEARIDEKITIRHLARKLAMGPVKLTRSFKQIYGLSIHQYIIKLRLQKSYVLLTTTRLTIGEIAAVTGFSSTHHFSNAFKKAFGTPPLALRKKGQI